LTMGYIM